MTNALRQKEVYVIAPRSGKVANAERTFLVNYSNMLDSTNIKGYFPKGKDVLNYAMVLGEYQNDLEAMKRADEVHVFLSPEDREVVFDIGMALALGKKVTYVKSIITDGAIIILQQLERREAGSLENLLFNLFAKTQKEKELPLAVPHARR